jgi:hypothetical protein
MTDGRKRQFLHPDAEAAFVASWPLVDERDDGIRPAGPPDECFYCRQKVGQRHGFECVIVTHRIETRVTATLPDGEKLVGTWHTDEPHFWDEDQCNFHKNESSWCASNFLDEQVPPNVKLRGPHRASRGRVEWFAGTVDPWKKLKALAVKGRCLCGVLSFEFVRVVDDTPRRKLKEPT